MNYSSKWPEDNWQQFEYRVGPQNVFCVSLTWLYFLSFFYDHPVQQLVDRKLENESDFNVHFAVLRTKSNEVKWNIIILLLEGKVLGDEMKYWNGCR